MNLPEDIQFEIIDIYNNMVKYRNYKKYYDKYLVYVHRQINFYKDLSEGINFSEYTFCLIDGMPFLLPYHTDAFREAYID